MYDEHKEATQQALSLEVDRFAVFRFYHGIGKGLKSSIKSLGCSWSTIHHGWICLLSKQEAVQQVIQEAGLQYGVQLVSLPKGMIPSDPKIANKQSRLEIMEESSYKESMQLFTDVYRYDAALRPEDFSQPPCEEGKSQEQIRIERDFHARWTALQNTTIVIEQMRKELLHLNADSGEKVFDSGAPLLIVDALIREHFLQQEQRTLYYCSSVFWLWNGIKYLELQEDLIRQKIYAFLRDAKELDDAGHLESFNPTKFKVDQIVDALQAVCYHEHHPASGPIWLDNRADPDPQHLLSFCNGLLDVEGWLKNPHLGLMPHTPLFMNVNALTFDFDPKAAEPKIWLQFLASLWPDDLESQETLQESVGYFFLPDTRLHKILLIIGPPRSGKGTIGRCLVELLGSFNVIGPTLSSLAGEFGLQPFLNKRLALISDARLNSRGNHSVIIERLLSISGEDPLTINRKFLPPLTVQLPTRIAMMSNELPDLRDSSGALARRYIVLTLTKTWLGHEDTALSDRIREELPGILLWAFQGRARLQERGKFKQPAASIHTVEDLEAMTSPIKAFITEVCEFKPHATISVDLLFKAWGSWCAVMGYPHPGNAPSFGKSLRAAFPEIEITRPDGEQPRPRHYKGICLK